MNRRSTYRYESAPSATAPAVVTTAVTGSGHVTSSRGRMTATRGQCQR